ncbi:hypothetical protein ACQ1X9_11825 [Staphylococcus cohnii]|uniref:hypothetical protein n=1 Tax=Staphylococcus cohnii TaxID=29382 RepID=UPI003D7EBC9F
MEIARSTERVSIKERENYVSNNLQKVDELLKDERLKNIKVKTYQDTKNEMLIKKLQNYLNDKGYDFEIIANGSNPESIEFAFYLQQNKIQIQDNKNSKFLLDIGSAYINNINLDTLITKLDSYNA